MSGNALRKRKKPFVQVPSSTIRDKRLSFRARGVLAYLLDLPEGWDVRSEVIAADGKEGRDAVRKALAELGQFGYYRLERRQHPNGKFSMGTAVSEEPVTQWAEEFAEFSGKAVPCIEQQDGTYKVKRADGRLTDDGFDIPPPPEPATDEIGEGDVPGGETGDGFSGAGFPGTGSTEDGFSGAGEPGAGFPVAGSPDAGDPGPFNKTETPDRDTDSEEPPSSAPPRSDGPESLDSQPQLRLVDNVEDAQDDEPATSATGKGRRGTGKAPKTTTKAAKSGKAKVERTPEEQARFDAADTIAHGWWDDYCPSHRIPVTGSSRFPGFRKFIEEFLESGCTGNEIKHGLVTVGQAWPSRTALEKAITARRGHQPPGAGHGTANVHHEAKAAKSLATVFE
ncbi:hypothetical protein [Actinomadura yumaensis]|uniref:Helix-turn-helix domain-containing protein n=1 Tax=Actinomadura yumaensis TaxID=111807 RepID=A0ABW2CNY0_9ACTN